MEKNVVNWFEIPVKDMARAKDFYKSLFGFDLADMEMPNMQLASFPMIQGGEFATGALVKAEGYEPNTTGTTVYFTCENLSEQLEAVEKLGGKICTPKTSIGEYGFIAHIIDSEGNRVALHSVK
ncbi:MAG: VOC family protein [Rhodothermaceae bacterium]